MTVSSLKARLARKFWFSDMPGRHLIDRPLRLLLALKALIFPRRDYRIETFRASPTNICNAACVFCSYPQTKMKKFVMPLQMLQDCIPLFVDNKQTVVDLGPAVGDPLVDPALGDKVRFLYAHGYKSQFTTNGILLHKHIGWLFEYPEAMHCLYLSFGGLDPLEFKIQYGVDKGTQLIANVLEVLRRNDDLGQPLEIKVMFRNREHPNLTLRSVAFQAIKGFFYGRVSYHFTHTWDNWSDAVDYSTWSSYMLKRRRKPLATKRPCKHLRMALVNADGNVRLCGCRVVDNETDGLVVGRYTDSPAALNAAATKVRDGFYTGNRPSVCTKCSYYSPE